MKIIKYFIACALVFFTLGGCSNQDKETLIISDKIKGELVYSSYTEDEGFYHYSFLFLVKNDSDEKLSVYDIDENESGFVISNGKEIKGKVTSTYIEDLYPGDEQYLSVSIYTNKQTEDIGFTYNENSFMIRTDKIKNIGNWTNENDKDKTKFQNDLISVSVDSSQSKITGGPTKDPFSIYEPNLNRIENIKFTVMNKTDDLVYLDGLHVSGIVKAYQLEKTRNSISGPFPVSVVAYELSSTQENEVWSESIADYVPEELQVAGGFILNPNQKVEGTMSFDESAMLYFSDKTSNSIIVDEISFSYSSKSMLESYFSE